MSDDSKRVTRAAEWFRSLGVTHWCSAPAKDHCMVPMCAGDGEVVLALCTADGHMAISTACHEHAEIADAALKSLGAEAPRIEEAK